MQESLFHEADAARQTLVGKWQTLTNQTLPAMAEKNNWPISLNHCFMRVCLDTAVGAPWHHFVKRPAINNLTTEQLHSAISTAQQLVETPALLLELNKRSVAARKLLQRPLGARNKPKTIASQQLP